MIQTATSPYDVAEHLRTPEDMAAYLEAAIEEAGDAAAFVARTLGDIARAKGMSQDEAIRCLKRGTSRGVSVRSSLAAGTKVPAAAMEHRSPGQNSGYERFFSMERIGQHHAGSNDHRLPSPMFIFSSFPIASSLEMPAGQS